MDRQLAVSAIFPTHVGFSFAASDCRTTIMVTLTDASLFLTHVNVRAGVAVSWSSGNQAFVAFPFSTSGFHLMVKGDCSRSSH